MNQLGQYLRQLRLDKGLTTRQLGEMAECSHSLITRIEVGQRAPSPDKLWRLIQVLAGSFPQAIYYFCLDAGVPDEVAKQLLSKSELE